MHTKNFINTAFHTTNMRVSKHEGKCVDEELSGERNKTLDTSRNVFQKIGFEVKFEELQETAPSPLKMHRK